jgi:hypothetical protein
MELLRDAVGADPGPELRSGLPWTWTKLAVAWVAPSRIEKMFGITRSVKRLLPLLAAGGYQVRAGRPGGASKRT